LTRGVNLRWLDCRAHRGLAWAALERDGVPIKPEFAVGDGPSRPILSKPTNQPSGLSRLECDMLMPEVEASAGARCR
jgi:hypothetical protein